MYMIPFIALVAVVGASPMALEARQFGGLGSSASEFTDGGCRDNILFFARGSTEIGNIGTLVGPPLGDGLKDALGEDAVAVEGIAYGAALDTNFLPGGADPEGIETMTNLVNQAASDCPDSNILVSGYSQGAAMVHRVVESLDADVQSQIAGAVTFGDTQNQQDNEQIPNFPQDKTLIICNAGDLVCSGTLTILAPHLDYTRRTDEAVDFFVQQVGGAAARKKL